MTQLRAIEILLRKCLPDLAAAEIKTEQTQRYVVEIPPLLDNVEWQEKYGPQLRVVLRHVAVTVVIITEAMRCPTISFSLDSRAPLLRGWPCRCFATTSH
jgi:hypothetical protein